MNMKDKDSTTHSYNDTKLAPPKTATKPIVIPKKRGRPGNKIATAFKEIPESPVNFNDYCASHNLSPNVLRQVKRHDSCPETGRVFVQMDKVEGSETRGIIQIWRNPNQVSPWLKSTKK